MSNLEDQRVTITKASQVKWDVYGEYAKTSNLVAVSIYVVTLIGAQTAQIGKSFVTAEMLGRARPCRSMKIRSSQAESLVS